MRSDVISAIVACGSMSSLVYALLVTIALCAPLTLPGQGASSGTLQLRLRGPSRLETPLVERARIRSLVEDRRPRAATTLALPPTPRTITLVPPAAQAAHSPGGHRAAAHRAALPLVFYGALAAGAGAVAAWRIDPDSGGYRDGWTTATDFPDKAVHALAAWAITTLGVDLGARPRTAALAVCGAGVAFEFAQGYASPYDIVADCTGAVGAALWQHWRARRKARRLATR